MQRQEGEKQVNALHRDGKERRTSELETDTLALAEKICPRKRDDVKSRLVDGELVILDRHSGRVHQLNRTATSIWERCNGENTAANIASQLCEIFDVDPTIALKDVVDSIRQLDQLRLLQKPAL